MDLKNTWLTVLHRLEPTLPRAKFLTWFRNTAILDIAGATLTVGVPTAFARDWLHSKYALKILQALQEQLKDIKELEFAVDALLADGNDPRTVNLQAVFSDPKDKKIRKVAGREEVSVTTEGLRSARLNPRYTLANFISGDENRLAHAAGLSVARLPGQTYNPLFIYGGVGLGKTHLLSAIGHEVITNDPNKVVVYLTAEMFTNEYISAVKKMQLDRFKQKYRSTDVLLVDDIQMLESKTKTQEEFFNVFNTLHNAGKQIVITSDRPPAELTGIMARLQSRLTWGLVTEIEQPSYESRLAILKAKTQERRAILDPEVLDFIAMNVSDSVRSLEGVLVRALAEADLLHTQPTVRSLGKILEKLHKKERIIGLPESAPDIQIKTPEAMIQFVAEYFEISLDDLLGSSRCREYSQPRQIAMYLSREVLGLSLVTIAQHFRRTHVTVQYAVRKIKTDLKKNSALVRQVNGVKQELGL